MGNSRARGQPFVFVFHPAQNNLSEFIMQQRYRTDRTAIVDHMPGCLRLRHKVNIAEVLDPLKKTLAYLMVVKARYEVRHDPFRQQRFQGRLHRDDNYFVADFLQHSQITLQRRACRNYYRRTALEPVVKYPYR